VAEPKDSAKKEAAKKPAAKKDAAKKEAAKKPAAKKDAAKKEAAKKPVAKKDAAAKKQAAKKPSAKKATAKTKAKAAPKGPAERPVVRAKASYVRIAPRKARLIANQVRGLPLEDAMTTLRFSSRGAARDIAKLIGSAAANAENNHDLVADDLVVADITVDEGPTLRRYRPRALGRATRINKRTSHIKVALTPEELD
jgi:ribosomal protein L22